MCVSECVCVAEFEREKSTHLLLLGAQLLLKQITCTAHTRQTVAQGRNLPPSVCVRVRASESESE